ESLQFTCTRGHSEKILFPVRRAVMSLRKLCFFIVLATIVAFAAAGRLNRHLREFDVPKPNMRLPDPALAADGSLNGSRPTNKLGRSHWVKSFQAKSATLPIPLPVQSNDARDLGAGKLLVASRDLGDPNFAEAVVLLVHYDTQGVVGLI